MSQRIYITQILPMVEQDLHGYVLEEDGDSGHTGSQITKWKIDHGIKYYINAPKLPDLSPIENVWQPLKFHFDSMPRWDEKQARQHILDIFERKVGQDWINGLVLSMPRRLQDCIDREGALTGW